jgi:hypothetical protein
MADKAKQVARDAADAVGVKASTDAGAGSRGGSAQAALSPLTPNFSSKDYSIFFAAGALCCTM